MGKKDRKPIQFEQIDKRFNLAGQIKMVGRANKHRPYIVIEIDGRHTFIADKDVHRLRSWCNEILEGKNG